MKVFVVGGHKNGTFSLHTWFEKKGLKSIHGKFWCNNKKLIENNDCFTDNFSEFYYINKIPELLKNKNSLFILNYRPLNDYMYSLLKHLLNGNNINELNNWRWPSNFSERILNTYKTNNFIIMYFKKHNLLDRLLVINICNGNNEENTRKLEKFLNLPFEKDILLEKYNHNLLPFDDINIKKYLNKFNEEIKSEFDKVYKEVSEEQYLKFLDFIDF
jgi:hypothetical protein